MKVKIAITKSYFEHSSESDYETAIELVHYEITEEIVEGIIDGVVPFSIRRTVTNSSSSFYEENYVDGGYGPGLEYDRQYDECNESIGFSFGHYCVDHRELCNTILASEHSVFEVEIGTKVLSDLYDVKLDCIISKHVVNARRALRKLSKSATKSISMKATQAFLELKAV